MFTEYDSDVTMSKKAQKAYDKAANYIDKIANEQLKTIPKLKNHLKTARPYENQLKPINYLYD